MGSFLASLTDTWVWKYFLSHFGWVDWALAGILFVGVVLGLKNGLSQEFPRLLEGLISLYVTLEYYTFFAAWIARETPWPESYAKIFTFAMLWFLTWFLLRLIFEILGKLANLTIAAPLQWVGGVIFGGIRSVLFCSMLAFFLVLLPMDWLQNSFKVQSWSGPFLTELPVKIHSRINSVLQKKV